MAAPIFRKHGQITYTAGQRLRLELLKGNFLQGLLLYVYGTATSGATAATVHQDSPMNLIDKVELEGDGDTIKSMSFMNAWAYTSFKTGIYPPSRQIGTSTSTAYAYEAMALLWMGRDPFDKVNLLPTGLYKGLDLWISWNASGIDIMKTAGTALTNTTAPVVDVYGIEHETGNPKPALFKQIQLSHTPPSTGETDCKLALGDFFLTEFLVKRVVNSVRSDTDITLYNVLKNDKEIIRKAVGWKPSQVFTLMMRNLEPAYIVAQSQYVTPTKILADIRGLVGYDLVDFEDKPEHLLGLDSFKFQPTIAATTATNVIETVAQEMFTP